MAKRAFIIGGSGQIGQATAARLLTEGWEVTCAQRGPRRPICAEGSGGGAPRPKRAGRGGGGPGWRRRRADRHHRLRRRRRVASCSKSRPTSAPSSSSPRAACIATPRAAPSTRRARPDFPRFPVPIGEDQPTVAAGPQTYSTRKRALEETLLAEALAPVTILRPGAIHGPASRHPREWFFVKRILDGRLPFPWPGRARAASTPAPPATSPSSSATALRPRRHRC